MANPHGSFIWYELMTTDPEGATRFYGDVVGWTIGDQMPGEIDYRMLCAPDGYAGGMLTLSEAMREGGARPMWLGYLGVDDVDKAVEKAVAAGATVQMPASDIPDVGRIAMIADPQGVPIYLMRGASDGESNAYQRHGGLGHVAWNELLTGDRQAALDFYGEQFGYVREGGMDMGPDMGEYSFLGHGGQVIGAAMKAPAGAPSIWQFYVRVQDVDAAAEKVRAGGGQVLFGPMDVPGGERVLTGVDPQGASFGLVSGTNN